jgi:hypothetical protein
VLTIAYRALTLLSTQRRLVGYCQR